MKKKKKNSPSTGPPPHSVSSPMGQGADKSIRTPAIPSDPAASLRICPTGPAARCRSLWHTSAAVGQPAEPPGACGARARPRGKERRRAGEPAGFILARGNQEDCLLRSRRNKRSTLKAGGCVFQEGWQGGSGCGSKLNRRGYAGCGPCFHLRVPFWNSGFLSHRIDPDSALLLHERVVARQCVCGYAGDVLLN